MSTSFLLVLVLVLLQKEEEAEEEEFHLRSRTEEEEEGWGQSSINPTQQRKTHRARSVQCTRRFHPATQSNQFSCCHHRPPPDRGNTIMNPGNCHTYCFLSPLSRQRTYRYRTELLLTLHEHDLDRFCSGVRVHTAHVVRRERVLRCDSHKNLGVQMLVSISLTLLFCPTPHCTRLLGQ